MLQTSFSRTLRLKRYPKRLRRFVKRHKKAPLFLPLVRFYTTNACEEGKEGLFWQITKAHKEFLDIAGRYPSCQGTVLLARFCNNEEELISPLQRFYDRFDYGKDMVKYLNTPAHIAQCVVLHLDGAGKDLKLSNDTPSYIRVCSRNSPYISATRHIYTMRRVLEFEQNHGDVLFNIVNGSEKLYILEVPRSLVIDVTRKDCNIAYLELDNLLYSKTTLQDLQEVMGTLFHAPISDEIFVAKLWDFYNGDIRRIVDYYLYLSRINESVCLSVNDMRKYVLRDFANPFKGDLKPIGGPGALR